jgi:hypothetical protein
LHSIIIIIIIIIIVVVVTGFLSIGTSLEAVVHPTTQASSFRL